MKYCEERKKINREVINIKAIENMGGKKRIRDKKQSKLKKKSKKRPQYKSLKNAKEYQEKLYFIKIVTFGF